MKNFASVILLAVCSGLAIAPSTLAEADSSEFTADLQPIALQFRNVVTRVPGPEAELKVQQVAWLEFTNIGNQPVEPTHYTNCLKIQNPGGNITLPIACNPPTVEIIMGQQRFTYPLYRNLASENDPPYAPGETYRWQLTLPNNTLESGESVLVKLDANQAVGQWSTVTNVYANDTVPLRAQLLFPNR